MRTLLLVIGLGILALGYSHGHSGRTDANGGHYDRSTGIYHCHTCAPSNPPPTPPTSTNAAPQEIQAKMYAGIWIGGKHGQLTRIEFREGLEASWQHAETLTLSSDNLYTTVTQNGMTQLWIDYGSAGKPKRFYRTILQTQ